MSIVIPRIQQHDGLTAGYMNADVGLVVAVERVSEQIEYGLQVDEIGLETHEFDNYASRFSYTLSIQLMSRVGQLVQVPYIFNGQAAASMSGQIPVRGQIVIILYVGQRRIPMAFGGFNLWTVMRRLIAEELFPEFKPGEVFSQAAIREDPMSLLNSSLDEGSQEQEFKEQFRGGSIYQDFKGRVFIESRHYRADGSDGAFIQLVLGNPAASTTADEANDFNEEDATGEALIAMRIKLSPKPDQDPTFIMNVTQEGKVIIETPHAWLGRAPGEGPEPETTVEVDVAAKKVIIDGQKIYQGRAAEQQAVFGNILHQLLSDLIDAVIQTRQPVAGAGPTAGPPMNLQNWLNIKYQLPQILSNTNLVE